MGRPAAAKRVAHLLVDGLHVVVRVEIARAAPIVLEIVDAPGGPGAGVLLLVGVAAFVAGAGVGSGRGIDADLETLAVDVIGQRFHVGEFLIASDIALGVAIGFPGVVDIDVLIAGGLHAVGRHGVGDGADGLVVDTAGELVPTVPAHGRSAGESVVADLVERGQGETGGHGALAGGNAVGDPLGGGGFGIAAVEDVEFLAGELDRVGGAAVGVAIPHGGCEGDAVGAGLGIRDGVEELA